MNTPAHIRAAQRRPGVHPAHPGVPAEQDQSVTVGGVSIDAIGADEAGPAEKPVLTATVDETTREIVHVTVTGPTGSGKSAICAWIVRAMSTAGVPYRWVGGGLDVTLVDDDARRAEALSMYRPRVEIAEVNVSRAPDAAKDKTVGELANDLFWLSLEPRFAGDKELLCTVAARLERERSAVTARNEQIAVLERKLAAAEQQREMSSSGLKEATDQLERFRSERLDAAEAQAKFDLGEMAAEVIELREDRVGLLEAIETAIVKIRGFAGTDESDVEFLKTALGQPQENAEPTNRFDAYSLADLAGQCRMQARDTLDPELTDFWEALNRRLTSVDAVLSGPVLENTTADIVQQIKTVAFDLLNARSPSVPHSESGRVA